MFDVVPALPEPPSISLISALNSLALNTRASSFLKFFEKTPEYFSKILFILGFVHVAYGLFALPSKKASKLPLPSTQLSPNAWMKFALIIGSSPVTAAYPCNNIFPSKSSSDVSGYKIPPK